MMLWLLKMVLNLSEGFRKQLDTSIEIKSVGEQNKKTAFLTWATTQLHVAEVRGNVLENLLSPLVLQPTCTWALAEDWRSGWMWALLQGSYSKSS